MSYAPSNTFDCIVESRLIQTPRLGDAPTPRRVAERLACSASRNSMAPDLARARRTGCWELGEVTMPSAWRRTRELAERTSNGTRVRLLWRHGTRHLWVEVKDPDTVLLAFTVQPERALDAFYHPYAYADLHLPLPSAESLSAPEHRSRMAREESREQ